MAASSVLLTLGCGVRPASDGAADEACAAAPVTITAPRADAVLSPGPATVTGTTARAGCTVRWVLRDDEGAVASSGVAASSSDEPTGTGGTFTVPLVLQPGGYQVTVEAAGTEAGTGSSLPATLTGRVQDGGPTWRSGASGEGVADGSLAAWRGSAVPIAGTWSDDNEAQVEQWTLQAGDEFGSWSGDLDVAIGAIDEGETWAQAAAGAYDGRWTQAVQELAERWAGRPGTLYIRFAHEFNGDWYPWSVTAATVDDFVAAWHRFRAIQQQWFPSSRLVMAPNGQTPPGNDLDWRLAYPGPGQVDVMSVSYFNNWPWTDTVEEFQEKSLDLDHVGAPRGLQRHLEFAGSVGLPFAVSEWSNEAWNGDSSAYMEQMFGFFNAHAGTGPGQLLYEVLFNVQRDPNAFAVFPETQHPRAAEAYQALW